MLLFSFLTKSKNVKHEKHFHLHVILFSDTDLEFYYRRTFFKDLHVNVNEFIAIRFVSIIN